MSQSKLELAVLDLMPYLIVIGLQSSNSRLKNLVQEIIDAMDELEEERHQELMDNLNRKDGYSDDF